MNGKPRYKCVLISINQVSTQHTDYFTATVQRLEHHEKLGPPKVRANKYGTYIETTNTSMVLRADFTNRWIETLNSWYYWD